MQAAPPVVMASEDSESLRISPGYSGRYSSKKDEEEELPFFPKFERELICQESLLIYWFETDFCQARYNSGGSNNGSNACTLIAIIMAYYASAEHPLSYFFNGNINAYLIRSLGLAMLRGNEMYMKLKESGQLRNLNLSIPEAIQNAGKYAENIKEWRSILYMQPMITTLHSNMNSYLDEWCGTSHFKKHNYLFTMLISDSRTVLFIFNKTENSICLVDSHQHSLVKGAVIAIASRDNFKCLCTWLTHIMHEYHNSQPTLYELSFLYFRNR